VWQGPVPHHDVISLVLHARYKVHALLGQIHKPDVVGVGAINGQQRRIAGEKAIVIQQQMQLDRALGATETRPSEHAGAQIDHRGVQADQLVFKVEFTPATGLLPCQ
jgi:hypothetical protein